MEENIRGDKGNHQSFFPKPCVHNQCNPFNTHTLSILPDGTIGCCDRTFNHGLYTRSIDGKPCGRYEALAQLDCKDCPYWSICNGGCPEEGVGGDWRRKTRFCEAIYKIYEYIGKQIGVTKTFTPVNHSDGPHSDDAHGDSNHGDQGHGDNPHGNKGHGDIPHGDSTHGDSPDWRNN